MDAGRGRNPNLRESSPGSWEERAFSVPSNSQTSFAWALPLCQTQLVMVWAGGKRTWEEQDLRPAHQELVAWWGKLTTKAGTSTGLLAGTPHVTSLCGLSTWVSLGFLTAWWG